MTNRKDRSGHAFFRRTKGRHQVKLLLTMLSGIAGTVLVLLVLLLPSLVSAAQEGRGYVDLTAGTMSGDFGTPTTSRLFSLTPTLGYVDSRYDVSVSVPLLQISNSNGGSTTTESGVGDVILRGGMVLLPEGENGFSATGGLAVKLPTASESKGLGTGETDYGAFLGLSRRFDTIKVSLSGGYIVVGDTAQVTYDNVVLFSAGVAKLFSRTEAMLSFEGRSAAIPGAKNPREIHAGVFHALSQDYAVKASAFVGLNDGGPANGFSVGMVRWF
ncbi:MAG: transporter [Nitrospiraceae bacterium]|nr:transporter [Nitrospiraceae bacterium]